MKEGERKGRAKRSGGEGRDGRREVEQRVRCFPAAATGGNQQSVTANNDATPSATQQNEGNSKIKRKKQNGLMAVRIDRDVQ